MKTFNLLTKKKMTATFLLSYALLASSCASHHWVSDAYPEGNSDLGYTLYSKCLEKVPKSVQDAAVPGYTTSYVAVGGGLMSMGSRICSAKCRNAQAIERKITDKCMKDNGNWQFVKKP